MKTIITVIKKELLDTLRDRRTLMSAVVLPALAMPLLLLGVTKVSKMLASKEQNKQLKIAFVNAPEKVHKKFMGLNYDMSYDYSLEEAKTAVEQDSLDAVLEFTAGFVGNLDQLKTGNIKMYYKSTNSTIHKRVTEGLERYKSGVLRKRIRDLNVSREAITPIKITEVDIASKKERIGKMIGGLLPYIFIIFCFTGAMYPALDLITGEKERGTMETLLTVPASRLHILIGKMSTIALVGISSALMTILGMVVGLRFFPDIPQEFMSSITGMLNIEFMIMLVVMLIPLSFFFAGMLSAMVIRANSFKEAQSYVTPMTFVVIVPAMMALIPGVELNWSTVWIPILNIALATKEIIAETINYAHYFTIVASLIGIALVSAFFSIKQFSKESMVLNS